MNKFWKDFNRSEFVCKCGCGFDTIDVELADVLSYLRNFFGQPVKINSGCRCLDHNFAVGGSQNSKHLDGKAADIVVQYCSPDSIATYLERKYHDRYGIGRYPGWTHIDVRRKKARWRK